MRLDSYTVPAWPSGRMVADTSSFPTAGVSTAVVCRDAMSAGPEPEFGVYLLAHDPGPFRWEHRWVRWAIVPHAVVNQRRSRGS